MMGIDKYGDAKDLRLLLYLYAMAYISRLSEVPVTKKDVWLLKVLKRLGLKKACIAVVNKTVRTAWAMLRHQNKICASTDRKLINCNNFIQ
ncbi:hypothetical protein ACJO1W_18455 [Vibrio parahaemolyticus]|uniref:hypothetical protein n=1 Tax=Vibrio parahaemolyticus TaxID=670 RepID=UPI002A09E228|nr:hypothetical protein [Vibrio parahaemolyticus]MDF4936800.1 hypothetical protein [Vibrio parahaemolyticus]BDR17910.1 hypothetical protein VspSTUT16_12560 [Vibrio sp. STUT-A16]